MGEVTWEFADPRFDADVVCPEMPDSPWGGHRNFAYDLVRFVRPRLIVELGVHWGTSFFAFCQAVKDDNLSTRCIAVDTWKGDAHAGYYAENVFESFQKISSEHYATVDIVPLRMVFADALASVQDDSVDILHIDGYHTYEAVSEDFSSWLCKVAQNGIALFHDVAESSDYGSRRCWKELRRKHPGFEFRHSYGLGVLFPKGDARFSAMLRANIEDKAQVYEHKAELQARQANQVELERQLAQLGERTVSLEQELEGARVQQVSLEEALRDARSREARTQAERDQAQTARVAIEGELARERAQRARLNAELQTARAHQSELEVRLNRIPALEADIEQALQRQADIEVKVAEKDAQIQDAEATLATIYGSKGWRALSVWRKVKYGLVLRALRAPGPLLHLGSTKRIEPAETAGAEPPASAPQTASPQAALERELDEARARLARVDSEVDRACAARAESEQRLEQSGAQKSLLESQLDEARARQTELEAQVARIPEIESEIEQARARQIELEALAERIPGLEKEAEQMRVARAGLEDQLGEAQARQADLEARVDRIPVLEADLEQARARQAELQAQAERIPGLEADIEDGRAARASSEDLLGEVRDRQAELEAQLERIPSLESELKQAQAERVDLEAQLRDARMQEAELERRLGESQVQRAELEGQCDRISALEAELDQARARQAELQAQAKRIPGLEAELGRARLTQVDLEGRLNEAQARQAAMEVEQGEAQAARIDLERRLDEARVRQSELEAHVERIPALEREVEQAWVAVAELEDRAERIPALETERDEAARSHAVAMSELETHKRQIKELEGAVTQSQAQLTAKAEALEQGGQQRRGIEAALALIEQSGSYRLARVVSRCLPPPLKSAYHRLWRRRPALGGNGDISSLAARGDDLRLSLLIVPVSSNGEHLRAKIEACLAQTRPGDQVILAGDHPTQPAVRDVLSEYKNRPGVTIVLDEANGAADTETKTSESSLTVLNDDAESYVPTSVPTFSNPGAAGASSVRKVAAIDRRQLPLPEHLHVLYVTNRYDAPYRYRCLHACLHLRAEGVMCDIVHLDDLKLLGLLSRYSVVVLFRLPWSSRVAKLVETARESGLSLIFDADDLVFEPGLISTFPFLTHASEVLWRQYEWAATRLARTLDACDAFVGATPALARAAEKRGKRAFVYPNLLHPRSLRASRRLHALRGLMQRRPIIAYLSGSMTHDEDFALIAPVLARIMSERRDVLLLVGGFISLDRLLESHADRIIRLPFQDWRVQPWAMNLARVNLAPLAVINDFTKSKSALKFFEAAIVGLPTVATPAEQFQATIRHGVNGYLADDADAWHESITACLDEKTSRRIGKAARQTAFTEHTHAAHHHRLRDILLSVNGKAKHHDAYRPLPMTNAEATRARHPILRLAARGARARAVIGIIRRAGRPEALGRPDLCQSPKSEYDHVSIDPPPGAPDAEPDLANARVGRIERNGRLVALQLFSSSQVPTTWGICSAVHSSSCNEEGQWLACKHSDPSLVSPPLSIQPEQFAAIVIGLAAKSDLDEVFAQLFWKTNTACGFAEKTSITIPVVCDGRDHRYVVSLANVGWPRWGPPIVALRFDPLNTPGSFRLEYLALLPARPGPVPLFATERVAHSSLAPSHCSVGVDIVVPIYEARQDVQRCVESVLRHANGNWRLILVDDASVDKALIGFLRRTAEEHPRVVLLHNEANSGFVVSANRGMRAAHGRDVLLLNSDTVVTEGFVNRLIACAYADKRTGIVTPFTNNGTICSIPRFCQSNTLPEDMSVDEYGSLVSNISLRRRPELVTAVGFCMYIRAEVFERIGYFDDEHFGRGFGEENDFSERAKAAGYTIRLCDDLFIAHTGKASFGDEGCELERINGGVMDRLHPRYSADVAEFCRGDPLRELHANVKYHVARRRGRQYPAMMFLLHASVFAEPLGGTEQVVRDLVESLALPRALIVFREADSVVVAEVFDGNVADALIYRFSAEGARPFFERRNATAEAGLGAIIDLFDVGVAHLHHLMHWPIGIWRALHARGIPYVYTVHDYYCVCPSWNLLNRRTGLRCACSNDGKTDIRQCIAAQHEVLDLPVPEDAASLLCEHRSEFGELLTHAEAIIAPSHAVHMVVQRRHQALQTPVHVIGHGYDPPKRSADSQRRADKPYPIDESCDGRRLRVALVGQVAYPGKGSAKYLKLMECLRSLPIEWHVFGDAEVYDYRQQLERLKLGDRLRLHGAYRREEICDLLTSHGIDLTVLLPTCDETFCFTLSESWLAGIPAIVSNVGALPERVRDSGAGVVVLDTQGAVDALRHVALDRAVLAPLRAKAATFRHLTLHDNANQHRQAYGRCWSVVKTPHKNRDITQAERELFAVHTGIRETAAVVPPPTPPIVPPYHASIWYRCYLRVKPCVPSRGQGFAKRMYLRMMRTRTGAGSTADGHR